MSWKAESDWTGRSPYLQQGTFMNLSSHFPNPEWVICGMALQGEHYEARIVASKTLTRASIEANFSHQNLFDDSFPVNSVVTGRDFVLTTHMCDLVIIDGPDYATCLKHLFETWSPDKTKRPAISPANPAIEKTSRNPTRPQIGY